MLSDFAIATSMSNVEANALLTPSACIVNKIIFTSGSSDCGI